MTPRRRPNPLRCLPLLVLLVLAACKPGLGAPARAVEAFYLHLNAGEYGAALDMYDTEPAAAVRTPDGAPSEPFLEWAKQETRDGRIQQIRIISEKTTGETSTVDFQVVYDGASPARRSVPLRNVGGQWKLDFVREG
jgi:hypothetical protein